MSSVSWKNSKPRNGLDLITVYPDGGEESRSIHVLSRWLQRLHTNQTEDNSIPMSVPNGLPTVEEQDRPPPRCRGGFRPIPCSDFIKWIPTVGLEDLVIKELVLWRNLDPPWHHEFVVVVFDPNDKYTGPNDVSLPNLSERIPIRMLVANGLTLRLDRGRRSPLSFGSRQIAVDVVEIMNPDADLGNCTEFWSVRADHSKDVEFFPMMRDLAYFLKKTMLKLGEDYDLFHRNCWSFAARLISLMSFFFFRYWDSNEGRPEVIWTRQKFGGFDGFGSIFRHLDNVGLEDVPRHQSPFRGLIDGFREFRKNSSSNPVEFFIIVWIASLSPALVRDLVDLDVSSISIAYSHDNKDDPVGLFKVLYTLTGLAKEGDFKAKERLVKSDIFERSAKYMQTRQWSGESDRALIHTVIYAFYSLFNEGADVEIGNAFVKSDWILALPRVFIYYPDNLATIALYLKLQSIEAAKSHLITTSVLHSLFNFIQSCKDDDMMHSLFGMIFIIASWSPSSRQALLDARLGTTITKILRSRKTLDDKTLDYLVKLLESLILVNPRQDEPIYPFIKKGALDSLKDAGVFQALRENYPSVLLFRLFARTQPPLDIDEESVSTQPEHASKVMNDLVIEGLLGRGDVTTTFQSIFPRGLIDGLRDLREKSSSNPAELFPLVWIASLSPALVGDLVDLDVSLIAIAHYDVYKDDPAELFKALYTLTRLAKERDSKAKAMLVMSDIFERSAKYMQTCQWSRESDRELIHIVINAFYSLFNEGADVEIGNAFVKSGWILALPHVFFYYPDNLATIALYLKLQSVEAAKSHLITTGVLHSLFNFIQSYKDDDMMLPFIVMVWNIAEWSPSSRQALLGAGLGTTITKILRSGKALCNKTLRYLVELLEGLILVNPRQDEPVYPLIKKGALDSLKNAGVFQALQENYPSVLLFHPFAGTQPPLDIIEEFASNPWDVIVRFLKTQSEHTSEVVSDLVKEGDVTTFQSTFPGVDLSKYGFDTRDASDSACKSTVVNIGGRELDEKTDPGILPSALTDLLHDSEHSILSVVVTPRIRLCEQRVNHNINAVSSCTGTVQKPMSPPPTPTELHTSIPHPHAFCCHSHNDANILTPEDAYAMLEIPENADESFSLRVQEFPAQAEKWREALSIIAKVRESERLRRLLETTTNPADLVVPTSQDLPRGLNRLSNTCYLNSLLQYFYIIRELREDIAHSDDKLTDGDLKRHRVGGRKRKIARAKKFVGRLADFFSQIRSRLESWRTLHFDLERRANDFAI